MDTSLTPASNRSFDLGYFAHPDNSSARLNGLGDSEYPGGGLRSLSTVGAPMLALGIGSAGRSPTNPENSVAGRYTGGKEVRFDRVCKEPIRQCAIESRRLPLLRRRITRSRPPAAGGQAGPTRPASTPWGSPWRNRQADRKGPEKEEING
jgi:hypothetical protein